MAVTRIDDKQLDLSSVEQSVNLNNTLTIAYVLPEFHIHDTDGDITDGGLWRLRLDSSGRLNLDMNTAALGDFSTQLLRVQFGDSPATNDVALAVDAGIRGRFYEINGTLNEALVSSNSIFQSSADTRLHIKDNGGVDETIAYLSDVPATINFVTREVPTGTIDSMNAEFTLTNVPVAGSEEVYLNGFLQNEGMGNDYEISGDTITFTIAPITGSTLLVSYRF